MGVRAAAEAASRTLPLAASAAARVARVGVAPQPWTPSMRRHLVDLLTAGPGLVPVWDELDLAGVIDQWLPEWEGIRLRGSSSPVHRFTIDRHSVETCVRVVPHLRSVSRPDILAVAALLAMLAALTQADARSTGPAAWTSWRAGLVRGLVAKTRERLDGGTVSPDPQQYEGWPADGPAEPTGPVLRGALSVTATTHHTTAR